MLASAYSTSVATTSTTGSTKGFLSFSSQSIIEGSHGPSLTERFHTNILHLSLNLHRYKGFSLAYYNIAGYLRLIQMYCAALLPSRATYWKRGSDGNIFNYIIRIPLQLCFVPNSHDYMCYSMIFHFIIASISSMYCAVVLLKNPLEESYKNLTMFCIFFICGAIVPILTNVSYSSLGYLLEKSVFENYKDTLTIGSIVCGIISCILYVALHFLSMLLCRCSTKLDFKKLMHPWAQHNQRYAHMQFFFVAIIFLEEFFPINQRNWFIAFTSALLVMANPVTIYLGFRTPIYQNFEDTKHLQSAFTTLIFIVITFYIDEFIIQVESSVLVIITLAICLISYLIYSFVLRKMSEKYAARLFSVYKGSKATLPPTSPLIFSNGAGQSMMPLSQEGYRVTQAFNSLEIKSEQEFHNILACGAKLRLPAIQNIDFIKWGLNMFNGMSTVIMCSQICHYFEEFSQTQTVLLTRLKESPELPIFVEVAINSIDHDHTDVISDSPPLYKMLEKKARISLMRCRRNLALFWGCVLKHSPESMKEDMCRLRDIIKEGVSHFDELMRCYPMSLNAISLYLSFLTEVRGSFKETYQFINQVSTKFIEKRSDLEEDQNIDGVSLLLKDASMSYYPFISKLSMYIEQERRVRENTNGPICAVWSLTVIAFITIIAFMILIIAYTLVSLQVYPSLLQIVSHCNDVIIDISTLTMASKRLCLFAKGMKNNSM